MFQPLIEKCSYGHIQSEIDRMHKRDVLTVMRPRNVKLESSIEENVVGVKNRWTIYQFLPIQLFCNCWDSF